MLTSLGNLQKVTNNLVLVCDVIHGDTTFFQTMITDKQN